MIDKLNKAMTPENQAAALACAKRIQAALGKEPLIVAFAAIVIVMNLLKCIQDFENAGFVMKQPVAPAKRKPKVVTT